MRIGKLPANLAVKTNCVRRYVSLKSNKAMSPCQSLNGGHHGSSYTLPLALRNVPSNLMIRLPFRLARHPYQLQDSRLPLWNECTSMRAGR